MNSDRLSVGDGVSLDQIVAAYHERTKNYPHRPAAMKSDWNAQPNLFRRYDGAPLISLPLPARGRDLPYWRLYVSDGMQPAPLNLDSISLFFRYSLSLTAWKNFHETSYSLRAYPSSGNLHPTEGYAILPPIDSLSHFPGVYHYAAKEHALERRAEIDLSAWAGLLAPFPNGSFLVGLSSIFWRQSWKYGERSYRFCQLEEGHVLGSMRFAASALGWKLYLLNRASDLEISKMLGIGRDSDYVGAERENPELMAIITPCAWVGTQDLLLDAKSVNEISNSQWSGTANILSPVHNVEWPVIDEVALAASNNGIEVNEEFTFFLPEEKIFEMPVRSGSYTAEKVILGRRSAHKMDATTVISKQTFFRMLGRLIPTAGERTTPWDVIPWRPRLHLVVFVHRVESLPQGIYGFIRDPLKIEPIKQAMKSSFFWRKPADCPEGLPLYLLKEGDYRNQTTKFSCDQSIAGDGAFTSIMIGDFKDSLATYGPAFYRHLFWEAGLIGQVLHLEAEEAGIRSSAMGCHFDDSVHELFGFRSKKWQSLYNFTVGGGIEDPRFVTLPAYPWAPDR